MMKVRILLLVVTLLAAFPALAMEKKTLIIKNAEGEQHFTVEIAKNKRDLAHGLMGRKEVKPGEGMVFYFGKEIWPAMWMRNTLVPLDMLFIGKNGEIAKVAEAQPLSEERIESNAAVIAVLEIKGGEAARRGIKPGWVVICPPFIRGEK